jgi:hypothetical protein
MPTKRVLALVDRQAQARERLSGNLLALLARLWAALTTGQRYDDAQVAAFAAQAAALSKGARTAASGAQEAYLRQILALLDTQPGRGLKVTIPDAPRGVDPVVQYTRPVEEFRRLRVSGLDEFEANERALRRLQLIGDTDVSLAVRDTSAQVLQFTPEGRSAGGRVIHPELVEVRAVVRPLHRGEHAQVSRRGTAWSSTTGATARNRSRSPARETLAARSTISRLSRPVPPRRIHEGGKTSRRFAIRSTSTASWARSCAPRAPSPPRIRGRPRSGWPTRPFRDSKPREVDLVRRRSGQP